MNKEELANEFTNSFLEAIEALDKGGSDFYLSAAEAMDAHIGCKEVAKKEGRETVVGVECSNDCSNTRALITLDFCVYSVESDMAYASIRIDFALDLMYPQNFLLSSDVVALVATEEAQTQQEVQEEGSITFSIAEDVLTPAAAVIAFGDILTKIDSMRVV